MERDNVDTAKTITHVGLCAGYGGIELGLKRVLPTLRSVALCEIEAFAIANLVAKMEAGLMDAAPVWTDLKTFPWESFRDRVDILTGGYPCQPFSTAGKRAGKDDPRHLWPWIADGVAIMRPRICFFENVEGHISLGLREVIADLESLGYTTTWGIFSASECGAPHQRKRVFIMAHRNDTGLERHRRHVAEYDSQGRQGADGHAWPSRPGQPQHAWEPPRVVGGLANPTSAGSGSEGGDAVHQGWSSSDAWSASVSQDAERQAGAAVADDQSAGGDGAELDDAARLRGPEPADGRGQAASWADASGDEAMGNATIEGPQERSSRSHDSPIQAAQCGSGGEGDRQTQPTLGGDVDGPASGLDYAKLSVTCDNRTDELRLLGNGVVPATAALAFTTLLNEQRNTRHLA